MNKKKLLPLNIQLFAEGGEGSTGSSEGEGEEKTYTQEEYTRQANELAKLKAALDKTNAENKKYKDAEKARLSDEEKQKLALEEREKEFADMQKRLRKSELTSALSGTFTKEHTSKLVEALLEGVDDSKLAEVLCSIHSEIVDNATKQAKDSIRKGTYIPKEGAGDDDDEDFGKQLAKNFGKKQNKAMEYFDNQRRK